MMDIKLPRDINYEELDHTPNKFPAFSAEYQAEDIGKGFDLTVSIFGYQLDADAVSIIMNELMLHLVVDMANKTLNKELKKC